MEGGRGKERADMGAQGQPRRQGVESSWAGSAELSSKGQWLFGKLNSEDREHESMRNWKGKNEGWS